MLILFDLDNATATPEAEAGALDDKVTAQRKAGAKAKRVHNCPVCNKKMSGCSSPQCPKTPCWHLNRHIRIVHRGIREFKCSVCGLLFGQKCNGISHVNKFHGGVGMVVKAAYNGPFRKLDKGACPNGGRNHRCSVCGALFVQEWAAAKHAKAQHGGIGTVVSAAFNGPFYSKSLGGAKGKAEHVYKPRGKKTSGYRGVSWIEGKPGKWRAAITSNKQYRHLGHFVTEKEAALAVDAAAVEIRGPNTVLVRMMSCPTVARQSLKMLSPGRMSSFA